MYELIIIGAGPAGITAGVYAARKLINFLVISEDIGGQTVWSSDVENYTGFQFITGQDLIQKFKEHLDQFNVQLKTGEKVTSVNRQGNIIKVKTDKADYETKTLIIASGRKPRSLGVEGEIEYLNKGVAYCATCDAPLFANRDVAVIGGGNSALDAVLQLVKIANKVYIINVSSQLQADPIMINKAKDSGKVSIFNDSAIKRIYGQKFVQGITVSQKYKIQELNVQGVFIEVGSLPSSDFIKDVVKNGQGEILINCKSETSIPGIFAAGDVSNVPAKQIIVACGEGAKASLRAFEYLNTTT